MNASHGDVDATDEVAERWLGEEIATRRSRGAIRLRIETRILVPQESEVSAAEDEAGGAAAQEPGCERLRNRVRRRQLAEADIIVGDEEAPQRPAGRTATHDRGGLVGQRRRRVLPPPAISGRDAPLVLIRPVAPELAAILED